MVFRDGYKPVFALVFLLGLVGCPTDESDPKSASPIKILQPKAESRYKMTDTVVIITETDYSKVAGNLSAIFSSDSGKTWRLILSAAHHDALARDTFAFPLADHGDTVRTGSRVKLRMKEYGATGIIQEIGFINID